MKIENQTIVILDDRDVRQSQVNGGLPVDLPPNTTKVIIRTNTQDGKEPA